MRIIKFRVWDTDKSRETSVELSPQQMKSFIESLHLNLSPSPSSSSSDKNNGLLRDDRGVRQEVRGGKRTSDKIYSAWHRTLHPKAYYTDIDGLEYSIHNNEIKLRAIYDIKEWHVIQRKYLEENASFRAMKKLSDLVNIPFYIIWVKYEQS